MVGHLSLGSHYSMIQFFVFLFFSISVFSSNGFDIPKETYLTFDDFLSSQVVNESPIQTPSDWVQLQYTSPLIGKFQIDQNTTLSISVFSGSIGDELANINRWRSQLRLSPLSSLDKSLKNYDWNKYSIRFIELNNSDQYFLIYWLVINNRHIFCKFVSSAPISNSIFKDFIEGQAWETF